jgi:hypothetical protein
MGDEAHFGEQFIEGNIIDDIGKRGLDLQCVEGEEILSYKLGCCIFFIIVVEELVIFVIGGGDGVEELVSLLLSTKGIAVEHLLDTTVSHHVLASGVDGGVEGCIRLYFLIFLFFA